MKAGFKVNTEADSVHWPKNSNESYVFYRGEEKVLVVPRDNAEYVKLMEDSTET